MGVVNHFQKLLVFVLLFCGGMTHAQSGNREMLSRISKSTDTLRVLAMMDYGYWFENHNLDSSARYYQMAGDLSRKLGYTNGLIKYYSNITYVLNQQGKTEESLKLNLEALALARKLKRPLFIADCLFNTGSSYNNSGEFREAIRYYLDAAAVFERMGRTKDLITVYDNIGGVFTNIGQYKKALNYNRKALQLARRVKDDLIVAKVIINAAITQGLLHQVAESRKNASEGLRLSRKIGNAYLESIALNTLADTYYQQQDFDAGLDHSMKALKIARQIDSRYSEMEALKLLASGYLQQKDYQKAIQYTDTAIVYGNTNGFTSDQFRLYDMLAKAKYGAGLFKEAYEARSRSTILKDSLQQTELDKTIRALEGQYRHSANLKRISSLEREKSGQYSLIISLTASLLILVLLSLLIYRNIRGKKHQAELELITKEQKLRSLEKEQQLLAAAAILKGQETERTRLARDLHDGLGGLLSGIKLTLAETDQRPAAGERAMHQLDQAVSEMRRIALSMMPEALLRFGLKDALGDFCHALSRDSRFVHLQVIGLENRLEVDTEIAIYRIVQELVNNAIRHGKSDEVYVQLVKDDLNVVLTVEDNGVGFDAQKVREQGIGLQSVRSRVELLNGTLDIQSEQGMGTSIHIDFHLDEP